MAFRHEIFISYRGIPPIYCNWVRQAFFEVFSGFFDGEFGSKPGAIYIDQQNKTGDNWQNEVFPRLIQSKFMLSFWLPDYFDKKSFSILELAIMLKRQKRYNKSTIIPIVLTKNENFTNNSENLIFKSFKGHVSFKPEIAMNSADFGPAVKILVDEVVGLIRTFDKDPPNDINYFDVDYWISSISDEDKEYCSQFYQENIEPGNALQGLL